MNSIKVIKECKDRDVLRLKSEMDNTAITFSTYVYYLTGSEYSKQAKEVSVMGRRERITSILA
jgi:hypothetical protein